MNKYILFCVALLVFNIHAEGCQYVAADSSECELSDWGCPSPDELSEKYDEYYDIDGKHNDHDCTNIAECPMNPNDGFAGIYCEADSYAYMKDQEDELEDYVWVDVSIRPEGTYHEKNNCGWHDIYRVECPSTLADTETTEPETTEPAETFEYAGLGELAGLGQSCDSFCATTGRTCNLEGTKVDSEDEFKAVFLQSTLYCLVINPGSYAFTTSPSLEDDGECLYNSGISTCSSSWHDVNRWCVCDGEEIVDPVAGCCTTWTAECYTTASQPTNNFHACKDCGYAIEHCDNVCSSGSEKSGDLADSIACQECCQGYDHEVPWNCPAVDTETTEPETTEPASVKTCEYVAIPSSECDLVYDCNSGKDEYYSPDDGAHLDYECGSLYECPMNAADLFHGALCEADAKGYMKASSPEFGVPVDLTDRPAGTEQDLDNCGDKDVYRVQCTSTYDIENFVCNYVAVETCDEYWNCYGEYDEFGPDYEEYDCLSINECPLVIDNVGLSGMICEADKVDYEDMDRPEGTLWNEDNCGYVFDVYEVVCVDATCGDGIKNQYEDDIDCGGPCGACEYDCFGVLFGISTEDDCGICDGDGSSCATTAVETTEAAETTAVETTEAPIDVCTDYEKKACRKVYSDECMWSSPLKSCVSNDWKPVCSDFTSDKTKCKRFAKEGYACEWSAKKCQATDAPCVPGWIEVELLKQKDNKTKLKYVSSIEDCIAFATDNAKGVIYEPNSSQQKCFIFATVGDYHPGTSGSADEVIWFNETC